MTLWSLDPFGVQNIFGRRVAEIFFSLELPFLLSSQIMIAYAWNEALRGEKVAASDLAKKLKIPVIAFTFVMFAAGKITIIG